MKKRLKKILENQTIIDSKLNALLSEKGFDMSLFKSVNPTITPPPPPPKDGDN